MVGFFLRMNLCGHFFHAIKDSNGQPGEFGDVIQFGGIWTSLSLKKL